MNSKQISFISMYRRMLNLLKRYQTIVSSLPTFDVVMQSFETNLNQMLSLGNQQGTDITGLRAQKDAMKLTTGQKALDMCHRIEAFAKITGDVVLAKKIHYTDTDLLKSSDYEFISSCTIIADIAESKQVQMKDYGVTVESITDLKSSIDDYKVVMDAPKEGYTGKKQATNQLVDLFATQATVIDKIDALVELVRFSQPAFYAEYQDTRKVVYRTGSITVKSEVTDATTGAPLAGATVTFSLDGVIVQEKTTSAAGSFTVKSMSDGCYTVTASRLGYVTQTLTANVMNVEMTTVKVALVAN